MSALVAFAVAAAAFSWARVMLGRRAVAQVERRVQSHMAVQIVRPAATYETGRLDRWLARHAWWRAFASRAERGGVERRVRLIAVVTLVVTALGLMLALASGSMLFVLAAAFGPVLVAWAILGALAKRRLRAFDEQLPDLLSALGASLRAGHGFLQSLQAVAEDAPNPAGEEFRRALREARLGRPVDEALAGVWRRVPSRDFAYVLTAITVQRQVGGSLAGLFDTVNETVRQRQQFARKVRALTATGRTSANALIALPFGMALLLTALNHSYLVPLFRTHGGRLMLIGAGAMMAIGVVVVRRVVSFRVS